MLDTSGQRIRAHQPFLHMLPNGSVVWYGAAQVGASDGRAGTVNAYVSTDASLCAWRHLGTVFDCNTPHQDQPCYVVRPSLLHHPSVTCSGPRAVARACKSPRRRRRSALSARSRALTPAPSRNRAAPSRTAMASTPTSCSLRSPQTAQHVSCACTVCATTTGWRWSRSRCRTRSTRTARLRCHSTRTWRAVTLCGAAIRRAGSRTQRACTRHDACRPLGCAGQPDGL